MDEVVTVQDALNTVPMGMPSLATVLWVLNSIGLICCVVCCIYASRFLKEHDNVHAWWAMTGAFICGAAPQLASLFIFN
jgi:hypothetical protein